MIIVGKHINDITLNELEYLLDENGDIMKFESKYKAVYYLKSKGLDDEDIDFIYTNESRQCDCCKCEKREDCYIADKFQRHPPETTRGAGLGLCPKLK